MIPPMRDAPNYHQAGRFDNCSNDCNYAPCLSHKNRVRIQFNCNETVRLIPNLDDYTPREVNACWYGTEEKDLMYESHAMAVHRMEAGKRPARHSSYRGLEKLCRKNLAMVDSTVYGCIDAVLDEQQRQWDESSTASADWELYREASLEVSRQSEILAFKMAMCDEREARKAYVSMANREFKLKMKQESCKSPSSSAGTEATEATNSTMAHEIKDEHHKMKKVDSARRLSRSSSSERSKTDKTKKSRLGSLKKKVNNKLGGRGIRPKITSAS